MSSVQGSSSARGRPLRRDAAANRERIIEHAEQAFAERGFEVSLHQIAEDLGMGVGTVYRHFPGHDDLVQALYERFVEYIDARGAVLLEIDDPYERLIAFIDGTVEFSRDHPIARSVGARVARRHPERLRTDDPWPPVIVETVQRAQADGTLREGVQAGDIAVMAGMLADLVWTMQPGRASVIDRMRAFVLDALRPDGAERPPLSDLPVSLDDVDHMAHQPRGHQR